MGPIVDVPERRVVAYVAGWLTAAALATVAFVQWTPAYESAPLGSGTWAVLIFLLATTASEAVVLHLNHGRSDEVITLVEAAIAINILLFPPVTALLITVGGIGMAHVIHRRDPIKLLFNMAQYAVALLAALSLFHGIGSGSSLGPTSLVGLVIGMSAFGALNGAAVAGIVALMENRPFRFVFLDGFQISTLTVFGNTAIGVLGAVVWQTRPELTPLLIAPAVTLHFAYRGVVRSGALLEAVATERDRLSRMVDGASDGIVLLDAKGTVEVWSPAMEELTGVTGLEAQGRSASELMSWRTLSGETLEPLAALTTASPQDPQSHVELRFTNLRGDEKVVAVRHTVLFDQHGRAMGDVVLVYDVTHQREVERMKDDFLARVSHELRTPLTPIKGYAQILLRKTNAERPLVEDAMRTIIERVDHMSLLIDDLLLVSTMLAGSATVEDQIKREPFQMVPLIKRVVGGFEVVETERAFTLECNQPIAEVMADPLRVEQVLTNLISNACKYSGKDAPVHVSIDVVKDDLQVQVSDRGVGIPQDQLDVIFEKFHRLEDPLTMRTGGIGLGLYISKEFAVAMNGSLTAARNAVDGSGSIFTLTLPLVTQPVEILQAHTELEGLAVYPGATTDAMPSTPTAVPSLTKG